MTCFFKEIRFSKYPACRTILQIVFAGRSEQFAKLFYTLPAEQFCKLFLQAVQNNLQNCFTPACRTILQIVFAGRSEQFAKLFYTCLQNNSAKLFYTLPAEQFCKIVLHPTAKCKLTNEDYMQKQFLNIKVFIF